MDQLSEAKDKLVKEYAERALRRAWMLGFEAGVETGRAVATDQPLPPSVMQFVMASLDEIIGEDADK
jgi:hypothetical protein